jgi:hypothetical protein
MLQLTVDISLIVLVTFTVDICLIVLVNFTVDISLIVLVNFTVDISLIVLLYMSQLTVDISVAVLVNFKGWPEPYTYVYIHRIFGDFQAKNTVRRPYIYGSGQPCKSHS